jgi:N-acetyl-1-D-myo-inositol-2-amino-2-deoxy-alpha-D-glucopyranoside deacetylase
MTEKDIKEQPTLLAVLAHPDDESFGMGGTLASYAEKGVDTHLICATRGEVGEIAQEYMQGFKTIADKREAELRCAAGILGLKGVYFLDYRDSGMPGSADNTHPKALAAAPLEEVAAKIAHYIRLLKPQVVITFDPIGGYRHPDHIAMHRATVKAFKDAADPDLESNLPPYQPQKLYFHTFSRRFLRIAVRLMPLFRKDPRRWGRNGDIDLKSLAVEDFPVHARVDFKSVADKKEAASACHASQDGHRITKGITGWIFRLVEGKETFMRAYPPPQKGVVEHDLFANIDFEASRNGTPLVETDQ